MFYSAMTSDDIACGSQDAFFFFCALAPGGVLPYLSHIGTCLPKGYVFFCAVYVLKRVSRLCSFGMKSGMVFEGTTWVYERIYGFNWVSKIEKYANSKWMLRNLFWCCANLNNFLQARYENGRGFLGQVGKRVWKMTGFGLKQGQDLEVRAAHPLQDFPGLSPGTYSWIFRRHYPRTLYTLISVMMG